MVYMMSFKEILDLLFLENVDFRLLIYAAPAGPGGGGPQKTVYVWQSLPIVTCDIVKSQLLINP